MRLPFQTLLANLKVAPPSLAWGYVQDTWPDGIPLTEEALDWAESLGLTRIWLINNLTNQALAEYRKIAGPALAEYRKIQSQALTEYEKIQDQAYAEYKKIQGQALAEYRKITDQALLQALKSLV
jgi:hypothetical protein